MLSILSFFLVYACMSCYGLSSRDRTEFFVMFGKIDGGDDILTVDEMNAAFAGLDTNNDGKWSPKELITDVVCKHAPGFNNIANNLFNYYDNNGDAQLTQAEYLQVFHAADSDGDRKVSSNDFMFFIEYDFPHLMETMVPAIPNVHVECSEDDFYP